jgi:hypothetical protein
MVRVLRHQLSIQVVAKKQCHVAGEDPVDKVSTGVDDAKHVEIAHPGREIDGFKRVSSWDLVSFASRTPKVEQSLLRLIQFMCFAEFIKRHEFSLC